jgi:hypothetical protein
MRSFVALALLLSLSLATQGRAQLHAGPFTLLDNDLVNAKDIEAAVKVLRRANYNFEDHVVKRSDTQSWREKGKTCYCRPDDFYGGYFPGSDSGSDQQPGAGKSPANNDKPGPDHGFKGYKSHNPKHTASSVDTPPATVTSNPHRKPGSGSHRHHKPGNRHGDKTHGSRPASSSSPSHHKGSQDDKPASSSSVASMPGLTTSSSSPSSSPVATPKKTCPSGYRYAGKGDTFIYNGNSLVDASNLDLSIDILSFLHPSSPGQQLTTSAKGSPKCQSECCCYRTTPTPETSCPSGYTRYSQDDSVVENEHSLVDLSHLSISLDILSFGSHKSGPVSTTTPAQNKPTCSDKTCCVKQTTKNGSRNISNHDSLVNASGAKVKICLLTLCA